MVLCTPPSYLQPSCTSQQHDTFPNNCDYDVSHPQISSSSSPSSLVSPTSLVFILLDLDLGIDLSKTWAEKISEKKILAGKLKLSAKEANWTLYNTAMYFSITWESVGIEDNNYSSLQIFGKILRSGAICDFTVVRHLLLCSLRLQLSVILLYLNQKREHTQISKETIHICALSCLLNPCWCLWSLLVLPPEAMLIWDLCCRQRYDGTYK